MTIPLTDDLAIHAEFELVDGAVQEFKVTLERILDNGAPEWLVRFETHGGKAHKHERWDNSSEERHKHPKSWTGTHSQLLTKAIQDMKANFEEYEERYQRWTKRNATT